MSPQRPSPPTDFMLSLGPAGPPSQSTPADKLPTNTQNVTSCPLVQPTHQTQCHVDWMLLMLLCCLLGGTADAVDQNPLMVGRDLCPEYDNRVGQLLVRSVTLCGSCAPPKFPNKCRAQTRPESPSSPRLVQKMIVITPAGPMRSSQVLTNSTSSATKPIQRPTSPGKAGPIQTRPAKSRNTKPTEIQSSARPIQNQKRFKHTQAKST